MIEAREYRRHEERRGRRHAFEQFTPARAALVVIDMVPFFVADNPYARGIVEPINTTAALLRALGGTVAWVVPAPSIHPLLDEEFYGPDIAATYRRSGGTGPIGQRLWPELDVKSNDLLIEKDAASAFFPGRSGLHAELIDRKIDSVLIAGTVANVCCESSIRDARTLGYRCVMLADANAAPTDAILNATLRTVYRSFGDVRATGEISGLLAADPG